MEFSAKSRTIMTACGFFLFFFGMYALILSLVGVQVSFLTWIDYWGGLMGLLIRLVMIITGLLLAVMAKGNFSGED